MSIIGPCVYASTIEPIWESDEAKILYQFLFYLLILLAVVVILIPWYFWFGLTCTIYTSTTWYTVSRCVCVCAHSELDLYTMLYTTAPGFPSSSSSSFFHHFLFSFCLGLVIGANQVFRVGLLLLFACVPAQQSSLSKKKTFFNPPLAAVLYPFLAGPCVREGSESVRRKWPGRWRLDVAGWRELVAYWKQENEVNCVVSISSSRDQTKKARNHARFTWPSYNTHRSCRLYMY